MYIRSIYLKNLKGNQEGTQGLLVTCVSHHMTDMQLSNKASRIQTNDLDAGRGIKLQSGTPALGVRARIYLFKVGNIYQLIT